MQTWWKKISTNPPTVARLMASWNFSEDWNLLVAHTTQDLEADGVFFADPDLGDLEIQRYADDRIDDTFDNTNWTFKGRFGALEAVYTGAFTDRETVQLVDYSDYLFVGQYLPYYICDASVTYPGSGPLATVDGLPAGTCEAPVLFVNSLTETEVKSHEFRLVFDQAGPFSGTVGFFTSDLELR